MTADEALNHKNEGHIESESPYYKDGEVPSSADGINTGPTPDGLEFDDTDASTQRQGRLLFHACDMKRAVIILDGIAILYYLFQTILYFGFNVQIIGMMGVQATTVGEFWGLTFPAMMLSWGGIYGALQYKLSMVVVTACYVGCNAIFDLILLNPFGFVFGGVSAYAHVSLAQSIHRGIMSKERYHLHEEYSCCCV